MCGFYLYLGPHIEKKYNQKSLNKNLTRRGPDQYTHGKIKEFYFEFYRLAMVNKKKYGIQPIKIDDNRTLLFNGEIYNFRELNKWGSKINTDSDLLAKYILEFGIDKTLKDIDGMYAITLIDSKKKVAYLIRDFPGIKPLYYSTSNNEITISSDIMQVAKDINARIDEKKINEHFFFRSVLPPNTIWEKVYQVEQGCIVTIDYKNLNGINIKKRKFFDIENEFNNKKFNIIELGNVLHNSIILQSSSIYKPSTLLSSGIDSGLIAFYINKHYRNIETYSANFLKEKYSEKSDIINDWKNKKIKHNFILDKKNINEKKLIKNYVSFKGSPITVGNEVSLLKIFKKVKKSTSLILSGEGADELFLGYDRTAYYFKNIPKFKKNNQRNIINYIEKFLRDYCYFCIRKSEITDIVKNIKLEIFKVYKNYGWEKAYQYFFLKYHIPSLLERLDKTSMFHSVEARVPFLSQNVIKYALNTNLKNSLTFKNNKLIGKMSLRELAKSKMGNKFAYRSKIGFPHPIYSGYSKLYLNKKNSWLYDQFEYFKETVK